MKFIADRSMSLLEALEKMSPKSSKTTLRSWLKDARITLNGELVKIATTSIARGSSIELHSKARFINDQIQVYYEDSHLIAIEKPAGLLSVATDFEHSKTAHSLLKEHYKPGRVFVVHRIDRETSGVMLFALNEEARDSLKKHFEQHHIERHYIAIVEGKMVESIGTWCSYLQEDEQYLVHSHEDSSKGQLAITHFETLAVSSRYSVLRLRLETGRKNQIRVHCSEAGFPVVGDEKYGARSNPIKRMGLHAQFLSLKHPKTNKQLRFSSPIPETFKTLVAPYWQVI